MQHFLRNILCCLILGITLWGTSSSALGASIPSDILPPIPRVKDYVENTVSQGAPIRQTDDKLFYNAPKTLVDLAFRIFAVIGSIIVVIAGIKIILSKGDAKKLKEGIMAIVYAGIGLIIIGSAWIIVRLILNINFGT